MAYDINQLRTELDYLKKDTTDVSNAVFISWVRNLGQYIYRRLTDVDPSWYMQSQTYTVAEGTQSLPADFGSMRSMDTGFFYVDDNGNPTSQRLFPTNYGSAQKGFYLTGTSSVTFFNVPTSQTYILRYVPKLTTIDGLSDYFTLDTTENSVPIVPDEYIDFIVKGLDVFYTQWDEDVGPESLADVRFVRLMDDLFSELQRTPQVYDLAPFNNIY